MELMDKCLHLRKISKVVKVIVMKLMYIVHTRTTTRFYKFHIEIYNDLWHCCQRGRMNEKKRMGEDIEKGA